MATHRRTSSGEEVTSKCVEEAAPFAMSESDEEDAPLEGQFTKHRSDEKRQNMDKEIRKLEWHVQGLKKQIREQLRDNMDNDVRRMEMDIRVTRQLIETLKKRRSRMCPYGQLERIWVPRKKKSNKEAGPSYAIHAVEDAASQTEPCMPASGLQPFADSTPSGPPFQQHL